MAIADLTAEIHRQDVKIAALERELALLRSENKWNKRYRAKAEAKLAQAREALRPLARLADFATYTIEDRPLISIHGGYSITYDHVLKAAALLAETTEGGDSLASGETGEAEGG